MNSSDKFASGRDLLWYVLSNLERTSLRLLSQSLKQLTKSSNRPFGVLSKDGYLVASEKRKTNMRNIQFIP